MKTLISGKWQVFSKLLLDSCWLYVTGGRHTPWDRGQQRARASPTWQSRGCLFRVQWTVLYVVHKFSSIWITPSERFPLGTETLFCLSPCVCMCVQSLQSCLTLCDPMDCSPPGSSVHGILQARILEWLAMPSSMGSSQLRDWTRISCVSCIGRQIPDRQRHLGSPVYPVPMTITWR